MGLQAHGDGPLSMSSLSLQGIVIIEQSTEEPIDFGSESIAASSALLDDGTGERLGTVERSEEALALGCAAMKSHHDERGQHQTAGLSPLEAAPEGLSHEKGLFLGQTTSGSMTNEQRLRTVEVHHQQQLEPQQHAAESLSPASLLRTPAKNLARLSGSW